MSIAHLLEDFVPRSGGGDSRQLMSDVALEEERLESFEKGYSAGWEDALAAQAREGEQLKADLVDGIEKLNFSYHDALQQLFEKVEPVFEVLTRAVLPEAIAEAFGPQIVEELKQMSRTGAEVPLVLSVPTGTSAAIQPVLEASGFTELTLTEDETLGPAQASLRLGNTAREVDGAGVLEAIRDAVDTFIYQTKEDIRHG
ncbi:ABC transporter ATP-binding protein [Chachezhania antarctica]|uniref:ABC transporter ATP-binding protein n=1 Tax=Chachezhania antarctica TaxID=2340860 RepID=UPI000EB09710|nr:ABC transporter ATP-binding protein [Chachezhania antarctica]|tara:strand:- start:13387 stop:13986 length:600 start_codon:yes stop_codon:yes gene_type:complete